MSRYKNVSRHLQKNDRWKSFLLGEQNLLKEALAKAGNAYVLSFVSRAALNVAEVGSVVELDHCEIFLALRIAGQADAGMFRVACGGSSVKSIPLGDIEAFSIGGQVDESNLHFGRWLQSFWVNILVGNARGLEWLCNVPMGLMQRSSTKGPVVFQHATEALISFWNQARDMTSAIDQAIASAEKTRKPWCELRLLPFFQLLKCIVSQHTDFNELLYNAAAAHKKYWTSSADYKRDPDGFVALELCALAKLAVDRGFALEVKSDYLPSYLTQPKS